MLDVAHWDDARVGIHSALHVSVGGPHPLAFTGHFAQPASTVDMRIYCAQLLEDFARRGGNVIIGTVRAEELEHLAAGYDLVVVSSGRASLTELFPRMPEYSPYTEPQRHLIAGLFRGIADATPPGTSLALSPGHGEVISVPILTFSGQRMGLLIEAIPDGALDVLYGMHYEGDPRRFEATLLDLIREHAPELYGRIDREAFGLTRPADLLQGAITPIVRQNYHRIAPGTFAVALGDVHVAHDPILAQGANAASHTAWVLGGAIRDSDRFDEPFCQDVAARMWEYLGAASAWSNAMLAPPPPHIEELLAAAEAIPAVADGFVDSISAPIRGWENVNDPAHTAAFLAASGWRTAGVA
jgi:hypothetical protein